MSLPFCTLANAASLFKSLNQKSADEEEGQKSTRENEAHTERQVHLYIENGAVLRTVPAGGKETCMLRKLCDFADDVSRGRLSRVMDLL